jgi:soluble lytic murein transglycosylase-like protein
MKPADLLPTVRRCAGTWPVPLIMGFCEHESSFNERAFRADRNGGSYGLLQLDVPTARDRGFTGQPCDLFDVPTNLRYGVAQLDWIADTLRRHGAFGLQSLVASYNEGVTACLRGNPDPLYVAGVLAARDRWQVALGEGVR